LLRNCVAFIIVLHWALPLAATKVWSSWTQSINTHTCMERQAQMRNLHVN